MNEFLEKDWTFLNCGSPADLWADYRPDGSVGVKEYGRYRDGHFLVSRFFVDPEDTWVEAVALQADGGAAAGLYYGDGGFGHFAELTVLDGRISIRRPRGIPMGDTFRPEGAERMEELAGTDREITFPVSLRLEKRGMCLSGYLNGELCVRCMVREKPGKILWPRVFFRSVNSGRSACEEARFARWQVHGARQFPVLRGRLKDPAGRALAGYSVHLCASGDHWARTDRDGNFVMENVPPGNYDAVAGKTGENFFRMRILSSESGIRIQDVRQEYVPDRQITEEIETGAVRETLNGIWDFDWDREASGIREKWFLPGRHTFSKVIRVPFPFHSLEAFGEGFLADDHTLKQSAAWYVNLRETGSTAWYQRNARIPEDGKWDIIFHAVSGYSRVWINEQCVGCTVDSYESFRFPAGCFEKGEEILITVMVEYPPDHPRSCRGKQDFWFHAAPGIWQDVFLEKTEGCRASDILIDCVFTEEGADISGDVFWVPEGRGKTGLVLQAEEDGDIRCCAGTFLTGLFRLTAEYETACTEYVRILAGEKELCASEWDASGEEGYYDRKTLYMYLEGEQSFVISGQSPGLRVKRAEIERIVLPAEVLVGLEESVWRGKAQLWEDGTIRSRFTFGRARVRPWDPETPRLFQIRAEAVSESGEVTRSVRQAGIRKTGTGKYFRLNDRDIYIRGVLDQGYNPWGIYTYLSRNGGKGSMEYDIRKAKQYGYNLIRMHIKDNEPGWYRLCDEQGMLVWNEHPSDFYGKWDDPKWRSMYYRRLKDMLRKQNYHPSVVIYSVFNESWGIMGGHELSAWEQKGAQEWQKRMTAYVKEHSPGILTVDNSGYAKTGLTDILDYHIYPDEFRDAEELFGRLELQNYPGSCFNCYNAGNAELMQDDAVRELLQRNCSMDLKSLEYKGNEVQGGQPVIISEFVHTGRLEQMVRKFSGIGGYVRMNLASQENEDTSPLSAARTERDFGYRRRDLSSAGYDYVNSIHLVWPDIPALTKRNAGEKFVIPVWVRMWEDDSRELLLGLWESRTDPDGTENAAVRMKSLAFDSRGKEPLEIQMEYTVPGGVRAVQLFFTVSDGQNILAENDVRFEVFDGREKAPSWDLSCPEYAAAEGGHGRLCHDAERSGYFLDGKGEASWKIPWNFRAGRGGTESSSLFLRLEMSTFECAGGTRTTDEERYGGYVYVELNGGAKRKLWIEDSPWDERGVFSNSACSEEQAVPYKKQGRYGYGFQKDIRLTADEISAAERQGYLRLKIYSEDTGAALYGRRMGRYGAEPGIIEKGDNGG